MDVDLLRPGAVPISPETVLWFEFLLDPQLLLKQLQKPNPDPSPTDLIKKFHEVITDALRNKSECEEIINIDNAGEKPKDSAKNIALKILSLKVAAYLKWNMGQIKTLPFKTQINLLQDLMFFTNDKKYVEIPNLIDEDITNCNLQYLFAITLYHRWLLSTSMNKILSNWQTKYNFPDMSILDENAICTQENINKTVAFLTAAMDWDKIPDLLCYDCFKLLTDSNECVEFDWSKSQPISKIEFCTQISFELGTFFFYQEQYDLAKQYFSKCRHYFGSLSERNGFQDVDEKLLEIYINACHGSAEIQKGNLLEQLNISIVNQYLGLTNILQQDNIRKEIPLIHRINLELDIQGALSSGAFTVARDLLQKIKFLNIISCVLDRKPLYQYSVSTFKNVDMLIGALQSTWKSFSQNDRLLIKNFLMELILSDDIPELLPKLQATEDLSKLFDKFDLQYINTKATKLKIPESLMKPEMMFDFTKKRKPKLEIRQLQKQLITTNDHKEIREVLVKIAMVDPSTAVWTINPQWELPIPLQSVLKTLPRGFLQDYSYVSLAKSREQLMNKNYNLSLEFLIILQKELETSSSNVSKLFKLVSWEILLVQISQLLDHWPKNSIDKHALADACEVCLQTNESVIPRTEIVEQCVICLLNLGRWDFLIGLDRRWFIFEVTSAIALTCQEIIKQKGNKKLSKNLWDLVLPIFAPSMQQKKSSGFHEATSNLTNLMFVCFKLKDTLCLGVMISLLAKMYNILTDEPSLEVQVEYINLWPAVVSNANSYNSSGVREFLSEMLTYALKEYPGNFSWLRLMGDINYANGHYKTSLSYYLKSLLIFHDYFNIPIRNDDHVFRRMIKCCTTLGCHTQAAVLCQFLEETDYTLAFRILSDQKICNDAVDAYYHCFWDTSILEYLIYTHHKKGEFQRRKCAIQVIGMLELNSSNNEEIQREASNLRKSIFLRALCKQYVFESY